MNSQTYITLTWQEIQWTISTKIQGMLILHTGLNDVNGITYSIITLGEGCYCGVDLQIYYNVASADTSAGDPESCDTYRDRKYENVRCH
jgi:hypothetical protein